MLTVALPQTILSFLGWLCSFSKCVLQECVCVCECSHIRINLVNVNSGTLYVFSLINTSQFLKQSLAFVPGWLIVWYLIFSLSQHLVVQQRQKSKGRRNGTEVGGINVEWQENFENIGCVTRNPKIWFFYNRYIVTALILVQWLIADFLF